VINTARDTTQDDRSPPAETPAKVEAAKDGTAQTKSGSTRARTRGTANVNSISGKTLAPMVFGRRATYFDNPRLAMFAPPRWPGGGGFHSARRSAKS
jgi:hypothetical protein